MNNLTQKDLLTLEGLFKLKQNKIKNILTTALHQYYPTNNIIATDNYLCAIGNIPIALVAHMDTVWEDAPPKVIFHDQKKGAMWSPRGLGADDRAGIFAILKILEHGFRPHIIFTTDEEIGGIGAEDLSSTWCPFENLKYIIELDRRGGEDCVFYYCTNQEFAQYIENFGFITAEGTFSDIAMICPRWKVCGVNLSIGYINEHTYSEILFIPWMLDTIKKVETMLSETEIPDFKWQGYSLEERFANLAWAMGIDDDEDAYGNVICCKCKEPFPSNETMAVKTQRFEKGYCYYCFNCIGGSEISFCEECNSPFEEAGGTLKTSICPECKERKTIKYDGIRKQRQTAFNESNC